MLLFFEQMSNGFCSVCGEKTTPAYSVQHRACKHWSHSRCVKKKFNVKNCPQCLGEISAPKLKEPRPNDDIDYVLAPGYKNDGALQRARALLPSALGGKAIELSPCQQLLQKRISITDIIKNHQVGLQHMLKEGLDIEDFLSNGYGWKDLKVFEDFNKGKNRALQTLETLGTQAYDFRDYPDLFPVQTIKKDLQLKTIDFLSTFGLEFPENKSLRCGYDDNWTAEDCVNFGFNFEDLKVLGLESIQQYEDLMAGLTSNEAGKAEKHLNTTKEGLSELIDLCNQPNQVPSIHQDLTSSQDPTSSQNLTSSQDPTSSQNLTSSQDPTSSQNSPEAFGYTQRQSSDQSKHKPKKRYDRHGFVEKIKRFY